MTIVKSNNFLHAFFNLGAEQQNKIMHVTKI